MSPGARPAVADLRRWLVGDAARLRAAATAALRAPVPTCPGWVGRDLLDHVGEVYAHKVAVLRLGRRPAEGEWPWAPDDDGVVGWFDDRLTELLAELDARSPDDPAWTFAAADPTVGFWWRRMAHETAIHRVDAELAAGRPPGPHEPAQARDGVAELLGLAGDPAVTAALALDGAPGRAGTVRVDVGGRSLLVRLADDGQQVDEVEPAAPSDAVVAGAAGDVYRALWNRPSGPVLRSGAADVLDRLAARLALGMA